MLWICMCAVLAIGVATILARVVQERIELAWLCVYLGAMLVSVAICWGVLLVVWP